MTRTSNLQQAAVMLTRALSGVAEVRRLDAAGQLEITGPRSARARVQLLLWGDPDETRRPDLRVWVIGGRNRHVRERLRERGENFIDLTGAIRIELPWLILDRTDVTPAKVRRPNVGSRNPFSDSGSLVTRTLFEHGTAKTWTVRELAAQAGVSLGLTSYVVTELERRGLIAAESIGRARCIRMPDRLAVIEQWTREYDWRRNSAASFHVPLGSPDRFLNRLPGLIKGRRWALTLQSGAALLAPHASWDMAHLYVELINVDEDPEMIGQDLGLSRAPDGNVVLMAPYYRKSIWRDIQTVRQLQVVSTLQLVLDLWHYPVRGREQAEHLLSRVVQ